MDAVTIFAIIGAIVIVLGIYIMKGNINSIPKRYRHRISEQNRLPYCKLVGLGTVIFGACAMLIVGLSHIASVTQNHLYTSIGSVIIIIGVIVCVSLNIYAVFKYKIVINLQEVFCMKKYIKEIVVLVLQLLLFYVFPLSAGPTDAMGMVFLIICGTLLLSAMIGVLSDSNIKYLYPGVTMLVFIPSVFIYYNETALVHAVWYLVISAVGMGTGSLIRFIVYKIKK